MSNSAKYERGTEGCRVTTFSLISLSPGRFTPCLLVIYFFQLKRSRLLILYSFHVQYLNLDVVHVRELFEGE